MTTEEKKLIAAMDDLLNEKPRATSLLSFWSGSASQSVINAYKRGDVVNV